MAPNYYTETIKYNGVEISIRRSRQIRNLLKPNYGTINQKKKPITKYFCEQFQKRCDKCTNLLMEPEDFDETLSDSSPKSSYGSDQTYYESDAKEFVIHDRFKYIQNQNSILLDNQLYFSDNELMIDDSSSSQYHAAKETYSLLQQEEAQLLSWSNAIESMFA
ncbi:23190_t:CDS:2, partial [Racocetra persica]